MPAGRIAGHGRQPLEIPILILFAILFGSILTVSPGDVWLIAVLGAVVVGTVGAGSKEPWIGDGIVASQIVGENVTVSGGDVVVDPTGTNTQVNLKEDFLKYASIGQVSRAYQSAIDPQPHLALCKGGIGDFGLRSILVAVLGADADGGGSSLTYSWTITGTPPRAERTERARQSLEGNRGSACRHF